MDLNGLSIMLSILPTSFALYYSPIWWQVQRDIDEYFLLCYPKYGGTCHYILWISKRSLSSMEPTEKIWNRRFILLFITNLLVLAAFYASIPIIPV